MTKKEYILKMLDIVSDVWSSADSLKVLVNSNIITDEVIDYVKGGKPTLEKIS